MKGGRRKKKKKKHHKQHTVIIESGENPWPLHRSGFALLFFMTVLMYSLSRYSKRVCVGAIQLHKVVLLWYICLLSTKLLIQHTVGEIAAAVCL